MSRGPELPFVKPLLERSCWRIKIFTSGLEMTSRGTNKGFGSDLESRGLTCYEKVVVVQKWSNNKDTNKV